MLRWAKSWPFFRCVHVRVGVILDRRPWLPPCVQSFVSPFASTASRHQDHALTGSHVNLSASKASRIHGNASGCESEVHRRSAPDTSSDAKISIRNASRQDVDAKFCTSDVKALAWSHHDAKSHFVDGDAPVSGFAARMPHAKAHFSNADVRGAERVASSCATQSPLASLQTLLKQTEKESQKVLADLQRKIKLLESEHFSLSEARSLLKARAFKSCSVEQLATALQELKKWFPCGELVRDIVVRSSNVLLQPAELVQAKLKLLRDFQVEEKVITKFCGRGGVLSLSMDSLQKKLTFYDNIGLTVAARNKMFWRAPLILSLSIEKSIMPPLKFLENIGLTKESILQVAQHSPNIFNFSLDRLMKKCEYIRQLGFSDDRLPRAFCFADRSSIENIEEHLRTLRDLGFTDDDVKAMIQSQPAILGLSTENLQSKVDFLISKQHRKHKEIVRSPACLMYSLQARIIPRFRVVNESALSKVYGLSYILSCTDSAFNKQFRKATD